MAEEAPAVCRVCLGGGARRAAGDERLHALYEALTGAQLQCCDGRPSALCYVCRAQLARCRRLAELARRSDRRLRELLRAGGTVEAALGAGAARALAVTALEPVSYDGAADEPPPSLLQVCVKQEGADDALAKQEPCDVKQEEGAEPPYACDECALRFPARRQLLAHLRVHNHDTYCKQCDKLFSNASSLKGHMSIHTGEKPFACHICSRTFRKKPYLASHIRMHEEKPYCCTLGDCTAAFARAEHLDKHVRVHARENPFACSRCDKSFAYKSALTRHARIHSGLKPFACGDCAMTFAVQSSLTKHRRVHSGAKPYACERCAAAFNHAGNLKRHMHTHADERPFACERCGRRFREREALAEHARVHTGEKPHACAECGVRFAFGSTLAEHERTHARPPAPAPAPAPRARVRPTCQVCQKQLTSNSHLVIHMRSHTGERPYPCTQCSQTFRTKTILKGHMRVHTGEKVASCEICGMAFTQTGSLGKHMRLHTGELYACHLCGKGYKQSGQLTAHIRNFHEGIKRFSCDICSARFTARGHLRNHMNAHAGIKPYACPKCSNRFATRTVLRRHIKNSCK